MSTYGSILGAVQTVVTNLGIQFNSTSVPVVLRKLPKAEETLDTLPMICVSPSVSAIQWRLIGFGPVQQIDYPVQIAIIAAGNRDFSSNIDTFNGWYERIRNSFKAAPLAGVSQVWKTTVRPTKNFDRALLNNNYDYLSLDVIFSTAE